MRLCNITYRNEVTGLFSIATNNRFLILRQFLTEYRDNSRFPMGVLMRAKNIAITEYGCAQAILIIKKPEIILRAQFGNAIRTYWLARMILACRKMNLLPLHGTSARSKNEFFNIQRYRILDKL